MRTKFLRFIAPCGWAAVQRLQAPFAVAGVRSHVGRVRPTNQDRFWLSARRDGSVFLAVADGLGGDPFGEVAADLVISGLPEAEALPLGDEEHKLAELALRLDRQIEACARNTPDRGGMGSTLVLAWLRPGWVSWVHVGDSRLYLLRKGIFSQVTQDQTLARFLMEEGALTTEEVRRGHYSGLIPDQYLGCGYCEPETGNVALIPGDLLLLATDGLHRFVAAESLAALLATPGEMEAKARGLVAAAFAAGGEDNITALVARIEAPAP
jgi:PPM family protein phosphatase